MGHLYVHKEAGRHAPRFQVPTVEKAPHVQEDTKHVPKMATQELIREVEVPQVEVDEKQVEVPLVQTVDKPFEKVVEDPVEISPMKFFPSPEVRSSREWPEMNKGNSDTTVGDDALSRGGTFDSRRGSAFDGSGGVEQLRPSPISNPPVSASIPPPSSTQIVTQEVVGEVDVPQAEVVEKQVKVPQVHNVDDKYAEAPQVQEDTKLVPKMATQEAVREFEVPQVQIVDKYAEAPQVQGDTKLTPKIATQEAIIEVEAPEVQIVDKYAEAPQVY